MNLSVNSKVFYPSHGAGWVKGRKEIEFGGEKKKYYEFKFVNNSIAVSTPIENIEELNIRPVSSKKDIKAALKTLKSKPRVAPPQKSYNKRIEHIKNLCDNSTIEDFVTIIQYSNYIKNFREENKRAVPVQIRKYLKKSKDFIIGELAVSEGIEYEEALEKFEKETGLEV